MIDCPLACLIEGYILNAHVSWLVLFADEQLQEKYVSKAILKLFSRALSYHMYLLVNCFENIPSWVYIIGLLRDQSTC